MKIIITNIKNFLEKVKNHESVFLFRKTSDNKKVLWACYYTDNRNVVKIIPIAFTKNYLHSSSASVNYFLINWKRKKYYATRYNHRKNAIETALKRMGLEEVKETTLCYCDFCWVGENFTCKNYLKNLLLINRPKNYCECAKDYKGEHTTFLIWQRIEEDKGKVLLEIPEIKEFIKEENLEVWTYFEKEETL